MRALHGQLGDLHLADGVAQRRLRHERRRVLVVFHSQARLLRIPHHPEHDGVEIHRHEIGREHLLGRTRDGRDALVDDDGHRIHHGDGDVQTRPGEAVEPAEAQHHSTLPFVGDVHAACQRQAGDHGERHGERRAEGERRSQDKGERNEEQRHGQHHRTAARCLAPAGDALLPA